MKANSDWEKRVNNAAAKLRIDNKLGKLEKKIH